ncbi:hypothetical protein BFU36_04450 [Sulfolobus sp. A20]|uniref:hypothetical protein n=1 Tax=Saccharolobus sp. A20 TaxID=1891280 RepID=UPI000845C7BF|nr:hypothetical protein [Sulfolobus sp. A20]AOL16096.1 hypothetical protein BFU36_04450 [Sulfolobus sp. A20]
MKENEKRKLILVVRQDRYEVDEERQKVFLVMEYNMSKLWAFPNVEVSRKLRGAINCPLGRRLHSHVNGALNIMKRTIKKIVKILKNLFPSS